MQRGELLTAYTPYQPEMSQGVLQAIFEYQTAICELTGMDVSNASGYDGMTVAADACYVAKHATGRSKVVLAETLNPQVRQVVKTYARGFGLDGKTFHLTDPAPHRIGEVLNIFAKAAHAPQMSMRINAKMFGFIPAPVVYGVASLAPVKRAIKVTLTDLGIPRDVFQFVNWPTRYDNREATKALKGSGIEVPPLETYAHRLWDYWERNLDPDLFIDRSLSGRVKGKVVVVTGGSSGIGQATALKLAEAGAKVIVVARDPEKLEATQKEIAAKGGICHTYSCDLTDMASIDTLAKRVLADHGGVDFLINNAGRSIRRSINLSYDRFHDFERTIQLNYFACVRLTMNLLPAMTARKSGHIVNISSIGVLTNAPRFSAYVSSKAALESFARCAAAEFHDEGVHFTIINMPLVRTPMIAPTKIYEQMPVATPDEAADMVAEAITTRPKRIATRLGIAAEVLHLVAPRVTEVVMNTAYRMFPDSAAAQGGQAERKPEAPPTKEAVMFASILRGVHW